MWAFIPWHALATCIPIILFKTSTNKSSEQQSILTYPPDAPLSSSPVFFSSAASAVFCSNISLKPLRHERASEFKSLLNSSLGLSLNTPDIPLLCHLEFLFHVTFGQLLGFIQAVIKLRAVDSSSNWNLNLDCRTEGQYVINSMMIYLRKNTSILARDV